MELLWLTGCLEVTNGKDWVFLRLHTEGKLDKPLCQRVSIEEICLHQDDNMRKGSLALTALLCRRVHFSCIRVRGSYSL